MFSISNFCQTLPLSLIERPMQIMEVLVYKTSGMFCGGT